MDNTFGILTLIDLQIIHKCRFVIIFALVNSFIKNK